MPPTVKGRVLPLIFPESVNIPPSELMRAPPAPKVMVPLHVLLLARFRKAPPLDKPTPISALRGSAIRRPFPST